MRPARLLLLASWVKALPDFVCQGPSRGPTFGKTALDHSTTDGNRDDFRSHATLGARNPLEERFHLQISSGVAQWLACWAHNPKVRGSKPRSANFRHGGERCKRPTSAPRQLAGVLAVGMDMRPTRLLLLAPWM